MEDFDKSANPNQNSQKPRIFCDCEGTLYNVRRDAGANLGPGGLNFDLFKILNAAAAAGYEVILFSSDPPGSGFVLGMADMDLEDFGIDVSHLDLNTIEHKSDYEGARAYIVFDDNHASHQVQAKIKADPANADQVGLVGTLLNLGQNRGIAPYKAA